MTRVLPFCWAALLAAASFAVADDEWPMEVLTRVDGGKFHGLLTEEREDELQFVEVVRPPGEPMYLVVHYYKPAAVKSIDRLAEAQREQLLQRIAPLWRVKSHRRIEMGRMEDVELTLDSDTGRYVSKTPWFVLTSTADEDLTRRCVVRVEQMFRAFETLFPEAGKPTARLTIELIGSRTDYRNELSRRGLELKNAAIYLPREQRIIAGADLRAYAKRLAIIQQENRELLTRYEAINQRLSQDLAALAAELKKAGFTNEEIQLEIATRRAVWKREFEALQNRIGRIQRRNDALFNEVTAAMFRRLFHESFHAWFDLALFPGERFDPPRWLHEGLAQVFERGQLEAGALRLDAPDEARMNRMREVFSHNAAMPIERIVSARGGEFLASHGDDFIANRLYLHSWALAWRLFFEGEGVPTERLKQYVLATKTASPLERFETLIGKDADKFQRQWRSDWLR